MVMVDGWREREVGIGWCPRKRAEVGAGARQGSPPAAGNRPAPGFQRPLGQGWAPAMPAPGAGGSGGGGGRGTWAPQHIRAPPSRGLSPCRRSPPPPLSAAAARASRRRARLSPPLRPAHRPFPKNKLTLVRVVLQRGLAVRLLQLGLGRVAVDAQEVVVLLVVRLGRAAGHAAGHAAHGLGKAAKGPARAAEEAAAKHGCVCAGRERERGRVWLLLLSAAAHRRRIATLKRVNVFFLAASSSEPHPHPSRLDDRRRRPGARARLTPHTHKTHTTHIMGAACSTVSDVVIPGGGGGGAAAAAAGAGGGSNPAAASPAPAPAPAAKAAPAKAASRRRDSVSGKTVDARIILRGRERGRAVERRRENAATRGRASPPSRLPSPAARRAGVAFFRLASSSRTRTSPHSLYPTQTQGLGRGRVCRHAGHRPGGR
jgi:hypothetical protein